MSRQPQSFHLYPLQVQSCSSLVLTRLSLLWSMLFRQESLPTPVTKSQPFTKASSVSATLDMICSSNRKHYRGSDRVSPDYRQEATLSKGWPAVLRMAYTMLNRYTLCLPLSLTCLRGTLCLVDHDTMQTSHHCLQLAYKEFPDV